MSHLPLERLARLIAFDGLCVVKLNRVLVYRPCKWLARAISRMGDGELWGVLILVLALLPGPAGLRCALHLGAVALAGLLLYLFAKRRTGRPRPCNRLQELRDCPRPLDEYSFPSGHTLHAVAFAVVTSAYFPLLGAALAVFAVLTGVVRVVLGLHYPSDVLAGVAIGGGVALLSLAVVAPAV
ncbi:phosphatase PAP2 family protein [Azoarcus olearius]|uniref:Conserved hypothetical phosphoesterase family protein n=1 Tax=Azoarcus sp. (strain BH72) TaxID=418699 RepID=A1K6E8_AZOSB|nr:phosphatase PAP2 family protein [Azoarcus olearius]ANQ84973.1 phosphoesterase family protein [Azoarcus olearius]CAL94403.1 conserved hypothetical phosphoesterase family protein [Azoarcus olearius]